MAPSQAHQVEKLVDEALKHDHFQPLETFLQNEIKAETTSQCSRQFINKLHKLIIRELDRGDVDHACLVLVILHKCGEILVFPGGGRISVMVTQGLVRKWFERARKLWKEAGPSRNERMIKLAEDFFDALMVVHESCKKGTYEVTESLLGHIGRLASDAQIHVMIQKEAARKLNLILAKIPTELKKQKKILSSQEASAVMNDLARRILQGGDYDLQVSLMEALCRMTSPNQRNELADRWFTMTFVSSAFKKIRESEFETDCRRFLNMVNGMQGDGRSVYSYPCVEAFLDKHELLVPADENLEAFWIDFNLGSQSISFYFSVADKDAQDSQWDTLCIAENEVQRYTVEEENGRKVLHLVLIESISIGSLEGSTVTIKFSSSLDILQATEKVYSQAKNRKYVRKAPSVVKTPVQIHVSSQVVVPESQVSPSQRTDRRDPSSVRPCQFLTHPTSGTSNLPQQMVTPVKMKVSESCMYISGSVGSKQGSCSSSCVLPAVSKTKVKPALQMMSTSEKQQHFDLRDLMMSRTSSNVSSLSVHCEMNQKKTHVIQTQSAVQNESQQQIQRGQAEAEKYRKHIPVNKVVEMIQADNEHEEEAFDNSMVPDSQPAVRKGGSFSLGLSKGRSSVSGALLSWQKDQSKSWSGSDGSSDPPAQRLSPAQRGFKVLTQRQLHTQLTQRLEEVLREQQRTEGHRGSSLEPSTAAQGQEKVKMSVRSTPARHTQQRAQSSRVQDNAPDTNKDNIAHAAESVVKKISSHYKRKARAVSSEPGSKFNIVSTNRSLLNKSWCPSTTEKTAANSSGLNKTQDQSKMTFQEQEDVYAFTDDTPNIKVRKAVKSSDTSRVESSAQSNSVTRSKSVSRPQPLKAVTGKVRKNLFSDTDTDNMTEVSWLNSANRKPKPKLTDYSRQPVKANLPPADSTFKSPFTPLPLPKPVKEQVKPKRKRQKKVAEPKKNNQQQNISNKKATGRPQRAAALTKTYREPSDSDSQSESDKPPPPKKKTVAQPDRFQQTVSAQITRREEKKEKSLADTVNAKEQNKKSEKTKANTTTAQIQQDQKNETGKNVSSPELIEMKISSDLGSGRRKKESWAARFSSMLASPPSIEKMRSGEKYTNNLRSQRTPLRSLSISPIEPDSSSPEPLSLLRETQSSSFCKTAGNRDAVKPPSLSTITPASTTSWALRRNPPAAEQAELNPGRLSESPAQHPFTSTGRERSTLPSPPTSADLQEERRDIMNKTSPTSVISVVTLSQSSHRSVSSMAVICTQLEKTPACKQGHKDERPEFKSGPSVFHRDSSSGHSASASEGEEDSDEDKENKAIPSQLAVKMKPRKLFKTNDKYQLPNKSSNIKQPAEDQSSSEEEEEETVTGNGKHKKAEDMERVSFCMMTSRRQVTEEDMDLTRPKISPSQEVGFICHQFSSDLKRKIQKRCRTMDLYAKQSLKTVQQHMSSVRVQIHKYSSQKLERVKQVLMDEMKNLEHDEVTLRSMEEELMTYWKKQNLAFHTYHEKGNKRLQRLKSIIQTDVCDSLQYEEQIFSSEMFLMKKNMKSVQERFFKEMQEEELLSVRRGLRTLFLPDASRF